MPLGVQLSVMVKNFRSEVGHSLLPAHGVNQVETIRYLLARVQETLYTENYWGHLGHDEFITVTAGVKVEDYPDDLPYEQIREIYGLEGTQWCPIEYGVGPAEYSTYNSIADVRSWPVRKWRNVPKTSQLEVWPIPNKEVTLMLRGMIKLNPMTADAHTCMLDSNLIVLHAAAEFLADNKSDAAALKLQKAQSLQVKLLAQSGSHKAKTFVMGGGLTEQAPLRPGIDYIP